MLDVFFALEIPHLLKWGPQIVKWPIISNIYIYIYIYRIMANTKVATSTPDDFYIVPTEINWHKLANYGASLHRNKWP